MISSVRGSVLAVTGVSAVIEVGGIGLSVAVTPGHAALLHEGREAAIHTALIVKEDDLSLYGFPDVEQLQVFNLLRGVTGVGPKSALGVLSAMSPDEIARAVNAEDDSAFRKVSGIGPKTAKLIVVSLAGKLVASRTPSAVTSGAGSADAVVGVIDALIGLGWSEKAASKAAEDARAAVDPAMGTSMQALLRVALAALGPAQNRSEAR